MSTIEHLDSQSLSIVERAKIVIIRNNSQYLEACELVKTIKALRAEVNATFDPIVAKAYSAHKESVAQKKKHDTPLALAEDMVKTRMAAWLAEQERLRREEELRLQKQAQEEEERRQLENAVILDELGETAEANRLLEETAKAAPIVLPKFTPKVNGISMTARYSAEVTNLMELVQAVASGRAPIQCLEANQVFLNRQAVAMRQALSYPGVRLKVESSVGVRR